MPTYEYKCDACGYAFERFQSIKAGPIRKCPECGKNKVKRLLSTGAGLIFKGSGFYITDYRSEQYKSAAKADSGPSSDGGAEKKTDAGGGTEAKPAAAAEAKPGATGDSKAAETKSPAKEVASKSASKSSTSSSSSSKKGGKK